MLAWLAPLVALILAVVAASATSLNSLTTRFHEDMVAPDARRALAMKAADALHGAFADEKDAMVMSGKGGLDDYATRWMTNIDHLEAAVASLGLLARTPAESKETDELGEALQAYVATGREMYRLKVGHESDSAIAVSNTVAEAARNRVDDLIRRQIDESDRDGAARISAYERGIAWLIAGATAGLVAAIALGAWFLSRRGRPWAAVAGE